MSGDAHAHALQNRDDDFDRMVRGEPCWPSLRFKREETKFPDGSRRFFDGRTRRLHVGRWAIGALTHFIFSVVGLYRPYVVAQFPRQAH
jgi:hypothetical protein